MPEEEVVPFSKVEVCGRTVVVISAGQAETPSWLRSSRRVLNLQFGVGADLFTVVSQGDQQVWQVRTFDSDAEMGPECILGVFAALRSGSIEAGSAGSVRCNIQGHTVSLREESASRTLSLELGPYNIAPERVPLLSARPLVGEEIEVSGRHIRIACLNLLSSFCLVELPVMDDRLCAELGNLLERHVLFPSGVNVVFARSLEGAHLQVRLWQLGQGLTDDCGIEGAIAGVVGTKLGWFKDETTAILPGGEQQVRVNPNDHAVTVSTQPRVLFRGTLGSTFFEDLG